MSRTPSGIIELPTPDGQRVIPASRRPDGSLRKEVRIRAGFVPQEDIRTFTPAKVESFKSPAGYVPGLGVVDANARAAVSSSFGSGGKSKSAKRNAKKRAAKLFGDGEEEGKREEGGQSSNSNNNPSKIEAASSSSALPTTSTPATSDAIDAEKKVKALRKKIRQAELLRDKVGEVELTVEEKEKVGKIRGMEEEIVALEKSMKKVAL